MSKTPDRIYLRYRIRWQRLYILGSNTPMPTKLRGDEKEMQRQVISVSFKNANLKIETVPFKHTNAVGIQFLLLDSIDQILGVGVWQPYEPSDGHIEWYYPSKNIPRQLNPEIREFCCRVLRIVADAEDPEDVPFLMVYDKNATFNYNKATEVWQCRKCWSYDIDGREFSQDERLRTDHDGEVTCTKCGNKMVY